MTGSLFTTTWDNYVQLVTIDLTAWGDQVYGFVDSSTYGVGLPELAAITWQGQVFHPLPFATSGYQRGGENTAQPRINLPDYGAAFYVKLAGHGLAPGAPVIRYQALGDDVLADDPHAPFLEEHYLLNSVSFDGTNITVQLATHLDYQRCQFPAHVMYRDEFPGLNANLTR